MNLALGLVGQPAVAQPDEGAISIRDEDHFDG
jgi:hypothetical protein